MSFLGKVVKKISIALGTRSCGDMFLKNASVVRTDCTCGDNLKNKNKTLLLLGRVLAWTIFEK